MCSYKLRIKSSKGMCRSIQANSAEFNNAVNDVKSSFKEINLLIRNLKRKKLAYGKLEVQSVVPGKKTRKFEKPYEKEIREIIESNREIVSRYSRLINLILSAVSALGKITYDADSLIYREDRRITILIKRLMKQNSHSLIFRLNLLKGQIKTIALRILEASKFEQKGVLKIPSPSEEYSGFAEKMISLAKQIWSIESAEKESPDILLSGLRKELEYLRKIELDVLVALPGLEKMLADIESESYILEEDYSEALNSKLNDAREKMQHIKDEISSRAQKIYEEIHLIAESK